MDGRLNIFGKDLLEGGLPVGLEDDFEDDDLVVFCADDEELGGSLIGVLFDLIIF